MGYFANAGQIVIQFVFGALIALIVLRVLLQWVRANFYNPISALSLDGFKFNPDFGKIKSAHDPREIQLAVRFDF